MARISVQFPFQAGDLVDVTPLSPGQPVYLLTGDMGSSLVIKAEKTGDTQWVSNSIEIMSIVSPGGQTKLLVPSEKQALTTFLSDLRRLDDRTDEGLTRAINELLLAVNDPTRTLFKMEPLQLTTLGTSNSEVDPKAIKRIASAANATGGLEDLGEIIAADMFNGNQDRFAFDNLQNKTGITVNGHQCWHLLNLGNIMVYQLVNEWRFVGLDSVDPFSILAQNFDSKWDTDWGFRIFHGPARLTNVKFVADHVAEDLKYALGKKKGLIKSWRLSGDATKRLAKGMLQGYDRIEYMLKSKYPKLRFAPEGIQKRCKLMDWTW